MRKRRPAALLFVGDGVLTYRDAIVPRWVTARCSRPRICPCLRPASVAMLAGCEAPLDYLTLMPYYLRAPQAERARKGKS